MKKLGLFFLILSLMAPANPSLGQGFRAEQMEGEFSKYFKKTILFFDYPAIVSKAIVVSQAIPSEKSWQNLCLPKSNSQDFIGNRCQRRQFQFLSKL
jgi:hypothetical protein